MNDGLHLMVITYLFFIIYLAEAMHNTCAIPDKAEKHLFKISISWAKATCDVQCAEIKNEKKKEITIILESSDEQGIHSQQTQRH